MIKLEHIKKSFGRHEVLRDVNLEVNTGEVVVILGPSGSGKTTLLRSINFLEPADKGKITVGDLTVDAKKASHKEILALRQKTAMVFQLYNLFKNKTALENVTEGLVIVKGIDKAQAEATAKDLLDKVGLGDKYNAYPSQLPAASSSGSASPAPWLSTRRSSSLTSRPAPSTRSWSERCSASWPRSPSRAGR